MSELLNRALSHVVSNFLQSLVHTVALLQATVRISVMIGTIDILIELCMPTTKVYLRFLPIVDHPWRSLIRCLVVLCGCTLVPLPLVDVAMAITEGGTRTVAEDLGIVRLGRRRR